MSQEIITREAVAILIARLFLGLLFLFQGYDALFRIKPKGIIATIEAPLRNKHVPYFLIVTGVYFTSCSELLGGLLLIAGFLKYYIISLLGINLLFASVAFGLIKPMWDTQHVFTRLVLLLLLLLVPVAWDTLSVDYLVIKNPGNQFIK